MKKKIDPGLFCPLHEESARRMVFPYFLCVGRSNDSPIEGEQVDIPEVAYGFLGIKQNCIHPDLMFMTAVKIECRQTETKLRSARHQTPTLLVLADDAMDPIMLDGG